MNGPEDQMAPSYKRRDMNRDRDRDRDMNSGYKNG